MWKILRSINKNLAIAIPLAMTAGLIFGIAADPSFLKKWITPLTFLMVYPMMVNLKVRKVFEGGDMKAQGLAQLINFGVMPFLAFGLGVYFFPHQPHLALGLLLVGLIPTSGMTISWTGFAKGNKEAAVKMTVIGLGLGALLVAPYVRYLFGASLEVNYRVIYRQIGLVVLLPLAAGVLTQTLMIRKLGRENFQNDWAPRFPTMSTLGVLSIVFVAMALKARHIYLQPQLLVQIVIPLVIFYTAAYLAAAMTGRLLLPRAEAISVMYGTVMRNLALALALAMTAFGQAGSSAALVVAVAFVIQVQSAAWSIKFIDFLFIEPENRTLAPVQVEVSE